MTNNKTIYFAHPISLYGKPLERRIISRLEAAAWTVVNPSDKKHQDRVDQIAKDIPNRDAAETAIMEYFVSLSRTCDGIAFTPFPDGSIGAGVAKETEHFVENKKVLMEAFYDKKKDRVFLTRLTPKEDLSDYKILSIEETRAMLTQLNPSYRSNSIPIPQPV